MGDVMAPSRTQAILKPLNGHDAAGALARRRRCGAAGAPDHPLSPWFGGASAAVTAHPVTRTSINLRMCEIRA
jgi:hypothetical protein